MTTDRWNSQEYRRDINKKLSSKFTAYFYCSKLKKMYWSACRYPCTDFHESSQPKITMLRFYQSETSSRNSHVILAPYYSYMFSLSACSIQFGTEKLLILFFCADFLYFVTNFVQENLNERRVCWGFSAEASVSAVFGMFMAQTFISTRFLNV